MIIFFFSEKKSISECISFEYLLVENKKNMLEYSAKSTFFQPKSIDIFIHKKLGAH